MNLLSPGPCLFFQKFAKIFPNQGASPVSTTLIVKGKKVSTVGFYIFFLLHVMIDFFTYLLSLLTTGIKIATGVDETGGIFIA
jgi:hypothetical protein